MHCFHTSAAIVVDGRVGRDVWLYVWQLETELLNVSAVAQLHRPRSQLESVVHICNTVRNFTISSSSSSIPLTYLATGLRQTKNSR